MDSTLNHPQRRFRKSTPKPRSMDAGAALRAQAAQVIQRVREEGASLADALPEARAVLDPRDGALLQELVYGVLREAYALHGLSKQLLNKPLKERDTDLEALLWVGLYQLRSTRIPAHAALHATVDATALLDKDWARGMLNATLRRYQREHEALEHGLSDEGCRNLPTWLCQQIHSAWPDHWQAIAEASSQQAPMTLRVIGDRAVYLDELAALGIRGHAHAISPQAIVLEQAQAVDALPGFTQGRVSVQDAAPQLAAELLDLTNQQRVLDACAAPGGKTAHILQSNLMLDVVALESDATRLPRLEQTLQRIDAAATILHGDAAQQDWWDGQAFDRILLDAPCSATGVIRRNPDIAWLRRPSDIPTLAKTQRAILENLWSMLKPNGILLYATCSILPAENTDLVDAFLMQHADAEEIPIEANWGIAQAHGRQLFPGEQEMDGFYYARLRKKAT
jgi:16S rRNA (cytosine967-C5)-methyltransferase